VVLVTAVVVLVGVDGRGRVPVGGCVLDGGGGRRRRALTLGRVFGVTRPFEVRFGRGWSQLHCGDDDDADGGGG